MTAATSSKMPGFFGARIKNNIKGCKKLLIVNIILEFLGLPMIATLFPIAYYLDDLETNYNDMIAVLMVVSCIFFAMSILLGILVAFNQFQYLYKKQVTDMNYSLPLTGTQRFFADFLSGIIIYIGPFIGAFLLALAISGIATPFTPELSELWENFGTIMRYFFVVFLGMSEYFALTVLAISFCGSLFESIFTSIALNVMIPATIGCVWIALFEASSYGIDSEAIFSSDILCSTTPIGAIIYSIMDLSRIGSAFYSDAYCNAIFSNYIKGVIIALVFYIAAAYFICKFRKAEDVSKTYVHRIFFYLIMTMGTYCVISLFIIADFFIGGAIIFCGVVWFIMEVITRRGFKKFWQAGIAFVISICTAVTFSYIFDATDSFGMCKKVPSSASVERVNIRLPQPYGYVSFKDDNVVKEVIKVHNEAIDRHYNYSNYTYGEKLTSQSANTYYGDTDISIEYLTYTGKNISRCYTVPSYLTGDLMKAIYLSDEFAKVSAERVRAYPQNDYFLRYSFDNVEDATKIGFVMYNRYRAEIVSNKKIDISYLNKLSKAYEEDIRKMTSEELERFDTYCYIYDFPVLSCYENTINMLEENGFHTDNEIGDNAKVYIDDSPVFTTRALDYFNPVINDEKPCIIDRITTDWTYRNYREANYISFDNLKNNDTDIRNELLKRAKTVVLNEKPIAILNVNDYCFILTDSGDNRELLEKLYSTNNN